MFTQKKVYEQAIAQASTNNIVAFKQTIAMRHPGNKDFSTVIFKEAEYRVLGFSLKSKEWELKHISGDGPDTLSMPMSLFEEYLQVTSKQ